MFNGGRGSFASLRFAPPRHRYATLSYQPTIVSRQTNCRRGEELWCSPIHLTPHLPAQRTARLVSSKLSGKLVVGHSLESTSGSVTLESRRIRFCSETLPAGFSVSGSERNFFPRNTCDLTQLSLEPRWRGINETHRMQ